MLLHDSRRAARTTPDGRAGPARRSGPRAVESRARSRRGWRSCERALPSRRFGPYTLQAAIAAVHARGADAGGDRLGGDRRPLRRAARDRSVAGGRAQPRGGGGDARRPRGGAGADRRDPRRAASWRTTTWRTPRAPTCCARLGRTRWRGRRLRAGAGAGDAGAGAALPRAADLRAAAAASPDEGVCLLTPQSPWRASSSRAASTAAACARSEPHASPGLHRLAVHRAEPAEPHQPGDPAGIVAIRLHRHRLEGIADVPGLQKLNRKARLLQCRVQPLRQRPGFKPARPGQTAIGTRRSAPRARSLPSLRTILPVAIDHANPRRSKDTSIPA